MPPSGAATPGRGDLRVGLVRWPSEVGIREAIACELAAMGHEVSAFDPESGPGGELDVVLLYGPFGRWLPALRRLGEAGSRASGSRPVTVFWKTEGLPDPRLPWPLQRGVGALRSLVGRLDLAHAAGLDARLNRFGHLGDLLYAHARGWLDVVADISAVHARLLTSRGVPTSVAPFGAFGPWSRDLGLERDVDVLWMGKRGSRRRARILAAVRRDLERHGFTVLMADDVEHPFVYGDERIRLLNRAKVTLNVARTWHDENSLRFCLAMPNGSLCVSETLQPHVPEYEPGVHYVAAAPDRLAEVARHYLEHEEARRPIVDRARQLMGELTMARSLARVMAEATALARGGDS